MNRKTKIWVAAAVVGLSSLMMLEPAHAGEEGASGDAFYRANNELIRGNAAEAVKGYLGVISEKGYSVPVLANLGEAYRRQGDTGRAVLSWERARLLDPTQDKVKTWLASLRAEAGLAEQGTGWDDRLVSWMAPNAWALAGSTALVAACLTVFAAVVSRRHRWPAAALAAVSLVVLSGALVSGSWSWRQMERAVVLAAVPARVAPVDTAEPVFELKAGETVTIEQQHREHVLVRNASGQTGWIPALQADRVLAGKSV